MNFFDTYMQMLSKEDTPMDYDLWSAAWCVGTAAGRSCFVLDHGNDLPAPIFLNPYIYMVSNKGFGKEQHIIDIASDIVMQAMPINPVVTPTRGLVVRLREAIHGQIAVAQMGYPKLHRNSSIHNIDLLASCPPEYEGTRNPYLTILSTTTPDNAKRLEPVWPHVIYVSRRGKKEGAGQGAIDIRPAVNDLRRVHNHAREIQSITVTEDAKQFLANYYNTSARSAAPYPYAFERAERNHVIRLAAINVLSELSGTIDTRHIRDALPAILRAKRYGSYLFAEASSKNPLGMEKLKSVLLNSPSGIPHKALYIQVRAWLKSYEYNGVLALMQQHGVITSYRTGKRGGRIYIMNDRLRNVQVWERIMREAGYAAVMEDE